MATNNRFLVKNGLDSNNKTLINLSDPVNPTDAVTKQWASNVSNLTSGTIQSTILGNSTVYIGTTAIALNRTSLAQALTGITSIDGSAATLTTARTISLTGAVTGSVSFDGSSNVSISSSLTAASVTGSLLIGYAVGTNATLAATDTILGAFGKVQGQINTLQPAYTNLTSIGSLANATGVLYNSGTGTFSYTTTPTLTGTNFTGIPNSALINNSITINGILIALGSSGTITTNTTTTNAVTFNNTGTGAISGSTFNGSAAITVSYNTLGAQPQLNGTGFVKASGTTITYDNSTYLTTSAAASTYQPLDADLTAIAGLAGTSGLLRKTAANTWSLDTNTYLTGNQTITLSGDVTGSGTTAITTTLANSGVTAGTYNTVTVNAKGLITSGSNTAYLTGTKVDSFNTRTGAVTLTSSDVTTALGYTPINKSGDTGIGNLSMQALTATTGTFSSLLTANALTVTSGATNNIWIGQNSTATPYNSISLNGNPTDSANMGMTGGGGTDQTLFINSPGAISIRTASFANTAGVNFNGNSVSMGALSATTLNTTNLLSTGYSRTNISSTYIYNNLASYYAAGSTRGTIKISIPAAAYLTMMSLKIVGFDYTYNTNENENEWEINVGAYCYSGDVNGFYSPARSVRGYNCRVGSVRFAKDAAGNPCILIGTTTSTWSYTAIAITDVLASYANSGNLAGTTISLITDETGYVASGVYDANAINTSSTVTASQFNGSGAGLTGTAASLTAGAVSSITSAQVTTALGYTPVNKAGDTGIGNLSMGALSATTGNFSSTVTAASFTGAGTGLTGTAASLTAGAVSSITSAQVTTALGYTPINKAGDTGIGALSMAALSATTGNFSSTVTAASFTGAGTGLTGTAASLSIGGNAATATTATTATNVNAANNTTNANYYPIFATSQGASVALGTDSELTFNPSTNLLTVGGSATFGGRVITGGTSYSPTSGSTVAIDCSIANNFIVNLPSTGTSITFGTPANPTAYQTVNVIFIQGSPASTIGWPATTVMKWASGSQNIDVVNASMISMLSMVYTGSYWLVTSAKDFS